MNASASPAPLRARLLAAAERRLPALTRLKQSEALPIALHRHRIYVLPTRFGLLFTAVLVVMLLGALNYNNNPALLLTCLLGAATYQSVFQAFRMLNGLELRALRAQPCHAGDSLRIGLSFHTEGRARTSLRARIGETEVLFDLPAAADERVDVRLHLRGKPLAAERQRVFSDRPRVEGARGGLPEAVGQRFRRLVLDQDARHAVDDRFERAAACDRDDRAPARLRFERHDSEIFLSGHRDEGGAAIEIADRLVRRRAQELHTIAREAPQPFQLGS